MPMLDMAGGPAQNIKHLLDKCFSPKILGHIEIV